MNSGVIPSLRQRLKSIPGFAGLKHGHEAKYYVLLKEGNKQIRRYYPYQVARTLVQGNYAEAMNEGFFRLAQYLSGFNSTQEKMTSTAPAALAGHKLVLASPFFMERHEDGWLITLALPSRYRFNNTPAPLNSRIRLEHVEATLVATIRYSGRNDEEAIAKHTRELEQWLQAKADYQISSVSRTAQLTPLYALKVLRRNEIQINVKKIIRPARSRQH